MDALDRIAAKQAAFQLFSWGTEMLCDAVVTNKDIHSNWL